MKIDIVVLWVDGNDKEWQDEKRKYQINNKMDAGVNRYRDFGLMRYWFRGIEKFAPWFNKIHFVTYGHLPDWLNLKHPKLNVVNHQDFIPREYLPTFSSHPIELNLHRINGLSKHFIYFNDDTFLIRNTKIKDFFINNLPCDIAALNSIAPTEIFSYILFNNIYLINNQFNKKTVIKKNLNKWFNMKYGKYLIKTLLLLPWKNFTGFYDHHLPIPFDKTSFEEVWEKYSDILNATCLNKFRSINDVSAWVFRYWRLVKGEFMPKKIDGKLFSVKNLNDAKVISKFIEKQKNKMICINDAVINEKDFETIKYILINSFNKILPEKSSFESF